MKIKKYLLFKDYLFTTSLPIEEVKKRLLEIIEPKQEFSLFNRNIRTKKYEGKLFNNSFKINQINIGKENTYAPLITGLIKSDLDKTIIQVTMELQPIILAFMTLWLGSVGLICLFLILGAIFQLRDILQNGFSPMAFIPFGVFIFSSFLIIIEFKKQSENAKEFLMLTLNAQEEIQPESILHF